jgi:site-specific DNA recombinase
MKAKTGKQQGQEESLARRKRVAKLIRVSTLAQTEEAGAYGIPAQDKKCQYIAQARDLDIIREFQIEAVSGKEVLRSPKMRSLLRLCKTGELDGIIMAEQSRLMRGINSEIIQTLEENKVKLYLPDSEMDFSNPSQKMFGQMQGIFSEYELSVIRARTLSGKLEKRQRGEWASGRNSLPYGLELDETSRLILDPKIEHVKDLFDAFIEGGGFTSFAELSRKTGIPYDSIEYILQNEIYTGYHVPKRKADPKRNVYNLDGSLRYQRRLMIPVEERERIKMLDDAPISEKQFAQVQRLLSLRREMRVKVKQGIDDPYLYRGLLRCNVCERKLITVSYRNKRANFEAQYYVCQGAHGSYRMSGRAPKIESGSCPTRRIRREKLEEHLEEIIATQLAGEKLGATIARTAEALKAKEGEAQIRIEHLKTEIDRLERKLTRLVDLHLDEQISSKDFLERKNQIELDLRASRLALEKTRPDLARITPEMWKPLAKKLLGWRKLDQATKRRYLTALGLNFYVAGHPGTKYHQTIISVPKFSLNVGGKGEDGAGEIIAETGEDSGRRGLVPIPSPSYSALDRNQYDISLSL